MLSCEKYDIMKMEGGGWMENKEYEYDRYEVKLSKLMNIQKDLRLYLGMLGSYALAAVINLFVGNKDLSFLGLLMCVYVFVVFAFLCRNPGRLEITRTTVQFSYLRIITLGGHRRVYNFDNPPPKMKETFTVCNIRRMEYLQTPFEKIFSCGHICIRGDVYLEFGKKEERTFTIYGVKHFDDISAWMKDFMILSADEQ